MSANEMSILERRRIEGEIIKPVHRVLVQRLGKEEADSIIGEAVAQAALESGQAQAEKTCGGGNLETFKEILPMWSKGGALETVMLDTSPGRLDYDVTRCRYAEMYREMGLADIGFLLSCGRDAAFIKGFAPEVEMTRTATIMNGAQRCDFRYKTIKK
jgi:hypothetical protein